MGGGVETNHPHRRNFQTDWDQRDKLNKGFHGTNTGPIVSGPLCMQLKQPKMYRKIVVRLPWLNSCKVFHFNIVLDRNLSLGKDHEIYTNWMVGWGVCVCGGGGSRMGLERATREKKIHRSHDRSGCPTGLVKNYRDYQKRLYNLGCFQV